MSLGQKQTAVQRPQKKSRKGPNKDGLSFVSTYFLASTSACIAESFVYPFDIVKTRMQINETLKQSNTQMRRGMFSTGFHIAKIEGIGGIYSGLSAAWLRHFVYSGSRFAMYEILRERVLQRNADGSFSAWKSAVAAMSAGAVGQFIASPTDLLKVQMQTDGLRIGLGQNRLYSGLFNCGNQLYFNHGLIGLWKGWVPNVQRAALVQLGDLAAYDTAKQSILQHTGLNDDIWAHFCASMIAGFVSTCVSTPSDVVKTRIMNEPSRYKSTFDCFVHTTKNEGVFALYKGFFPIWARQGPKAMILWISFEQLRNILGFSSW